jgi:hypothetical protein
MYSYCYVYVFLVYVYVSSSCQLALFGYPEVFPSFFLSCKANARVYYSQRRGTGHTLPKLFVLFYVLFVLCRSAYYLCVNVYCTTATEWQPNFILTNISSITPNSGFTSPLTSSRTSFFCVTYTLLRFQTQNVKGKAIPLQAWTGPDGSNRMRFPDFKTIST